MEAFLGSDLHTHYKRIHPCPLLVWTAAPMGQSVFQVLTLGVSIVLASAGFLALVYFAIIFLSLLYRLFIPGMNVFPRRCGRD